MATKKFLITNPVQRSLFLGRGVPHYVLLGNYPNYFDSAIQRVEVQRNDGMKTIKPARQKQMLDATLADPYASNYLYAIGSDGPDTLACQIALRIMLEAATQDPTGKDGRPYWHVLTGSTRDPLRDNPDWKETQAARMSLLILSNIAGNSTGMKVEKLRDLIVLNSGIPRVVVVSGVDPMKFFIETLAIKPTRVMYFGRRRED